MHIWWWLLVQASQCQEVIPEKKQTIKDLDRGIDAAMSVPRFAIKLQALSLASKSQILAEKFAESGDKKDWAVPTRAIFGSSLTNGLSTEGDFCYRKSKHRRRRCSACWWLHRVEKLQITRRRENILDITRLQTFGTSSGLNMTASPNNSAGLAMVCHNLSSLYHGWWMLMVI